MPDTKRNAVDDEIANILTVCLLIDEQLGPRTGGGSGTVPCPACAHFKEPGTVRWSAMRKSGTKQLRAVRAVCSTPGCLRFMS